MYLRISIIAIFLIISLSPGLFSQWLGEYGSARSAMVVSEHELASEVGVRILYNGGNAVDAAVAVGFALAVVYPEAGNIGGGGFMVIRFPDGTATTIDYREKAPALAHQDVYIDEDGNLRRDWSLVGACAAGVPGSIAGLIKAWEKFGRLPFADLLNPAINLAKDGFILRTNDVRVIYSLRRQLTRFEETAEIFFPNGRTYRAGDRFVQPDLALVLERIRDQGKDGFYRGETADLIVETMQRHSGWITHDDLANYEAVEREPVRGIYRGHEIISMGPPSSGGVALIQMLQMLENADVSEYRHRSTEHVHLFAEVMKRAFADRNAYIGDPDFVDIPLEMLLSPEHNRAQYESIEADRATVVDETPAIREGSETTHYSVIDEDGVAVSVTTTINSLFGSKLVVRGAGFFLNNEMNDFSLQQGVRDQFGLLASEPNKIEAGKRMVSSMTPTIVVHNNEPVLILGARGGPRIISAVFNVVTNMIDFGMQLDRAVGAPFFHHQWHPDRLEYISNALSFGQLRELRRMGHAPVRRRAMGRVAAIARDGDYLFGATTLYSGGGIKGY